MVLQFLHNFGKVLGLEENLNNLKLSDIQDGLLNIKDYKNKVQDLLVRMLSIAVSSPGIPVGHKVSLLFWSFKNMIFIPEKINFCKNLNVVKKL